MISSSSRVILASASPRRRALLDDIGVAHVVVPSDYPEPPLLNATPAQLALIHAIEKAKAVGKKYPDDYIIAADTVVDLDGEPLGKPRDGADAVAMLTRLAGRMHQVHTGYAVLAGDKLQAECVSVKVEMYALSAAVIASYVATGEPLDKAGAYGIQGRGALHVARVDGDYFAVVGLPISRVMHALIRAGYQDS